MSDDAREWTLDDLGRAEAGFARDVQRTREALGRLAAARTTTAAAMDGFLDAFAAKQIDWAAATDEEVEQVAAALDTIYGVPCPDCKNGEVILSPQWPSGDLPYSEKCATCGGGYES